MDNFDDLLVRAHRAHAGHTNRPFAHLFGKDLDRRQCDIGIKQGKPYLAQGRIDIRFGQGAAPCQPVKYIRQFVFQRFKHALRPFAPLSKTGLSPQNYHLHRPITPVMMADSKTAPVLENFKDVWNP